jgi:hypothetical protein
MRADLPDLPEIMVAGVSLTEALALWSQMQNCPGLTPAEAREILAQLEFARAKHRGALN